MRRLVEVAEYDGSGIMLRRYMHGPGTDEPILWDEGQAMDCSGTRFLHTNHQGSIIAVANCNGLPLKINVYDEYGIPNTGHFQNRIPKNQSFETFTGPSAYPSPALTSRGLTR